MRKPFTIYIFQEGEMTGLLRLLTVVSFFSIIFFLAGCADKVPVEPPPGTGTAFQRTLDETQTAVRSVLAKAGFGIRKESPEYIEAIHLKPGETVEDSDGELVGIWFTDRGNSVVVRMDTMKNTSEVASQKDWEKPLLAALMHELE